MDEEEYYAFARDHESQFAYAHSELVPQMRYMLVGWLIEAATTLGLWVETLHLAVNLVDRFFERCLATTARNEYQLVGIAALFVASKVEEDDATRAAELAWITADTYTVEELFAMEVRLLKVVDYRVTLFTPVYFTRYYEKYVPAAVSQAARRLAAVMLFSPSAPAHRPSQWAGSCVRLARGKARDGLDLELQALAAALAPEFQRVIDAFLAAAETTTA